MRSNSRRLIEPVPSSFSIVFPLPLPLHILHVELPPPIQVLYNRRQCLAAWEVRVLSCKNSPSFVLYPSRSARAWRWPPARRPLRNMRAVATLAEATWVSAAAAVSAAVGMAVMGAGGGGLG